MRRIAVLELGPRVLAQMPCVRRGLEVAVIHYAAWGTMRTLCGKRARKRGVTVTVTQALVTCLECRRRMEAGHAD